MSDTTNASHVPHSSDGVIHDDFGEWIEAHIRHARNRAYLMPTIDEMDIRASIARIVPAHRTGRNPTPGQPDESHATLLGSRAVATFSAGVSGRRERKSPHVIPCLPEDGECADQLDKIRNEPMLHQSHSHHSSSGEG